MPLVTERPVVSLIADELFRRLETLVAVPIEDIVIKGVIRPTRLGTYMPEHCLIVLTRGDSVRVPDLDCPGNPPAVAMMQTFNVRCHIAPSEKDPTPVERYEDVITAIIHQAVTTGTDWHRFDANAIDAMVEPTESISGDGGYDGINIPVNVIYRTDEGDPYTVRM